MTMTLSTLCLIIAVIALLVLAFKYYRVASRIEVRARELVAHWENTERDRIRQQETEIAVRGALTQLQEWKLNFTSAIREDAVRRSQAVTLGKVTEHLVPFLPDFCYNPKDARFIGSPIDFIVFDGLNEGELSQIVFVEVKTASATLNKLQRRVREAIQSGSCSLVWRELRVEGARSPGAPASSSVGE